MLKLPDVVGIHLDKWFPGQSQDFIAENFDPCEDPRGRLTAKTLFTNDEG